MHGFLHPEAKASYGIFQWGILGEPKLQYKNGYAIFPKLNTWMIRGHFWPFSIQIELKWFNFEWRTKRCVKAQASPFEKNVKWYGIFSKAGIRAPFYSERTW